MSRTLFVSDLHLDPERPAVTARFLALLAREGGAADAIYILGDLFEAWIGDDDDSPPGSDVCAALQRCTAAGTPVYLMHGNRDFLLGAGFTARSGGTLLEDPALIDLYGTPALLMHGDLLCTDDTEYLQFREQVRSNTWQQAMLARPLDERRTLARDMRAASRAQNSGKPESIMDVNATAVNDVMRRYGTSLLIHGHTHRPAIHEFRLDGAPARRIVLGDWYEQGSMLVCTPQGCSLQEPDALPR